MQLSYEFQALAASNADGKVSVKEINAASIELRYIDNYSEFEKWKDDNPGIYTLGNAHEILFEDLEIELSQEEANNSQLPEGVEIEFGDKKKGNIRTETTPKEERWLRDDIEASKKIVLEVPPELRTIELNEAISRAKRVKYNVGKTVGDRAQIFIKFKGVDGETSLEEFEADRKGIQPQATSGGQATAGDTTAVDTATTPSDSSAAPDSASSVVQPPAQDSASLNVQPAAADTLDLTGRSGPEIARERLKPENQGKIIMYEGQRLVPKKQE